MDKLKFVRPSLDNKADALDYISEFYKYNSPIEGVNGLHKYLDNYEGWLEKINKESTQEATEKVVPNDTFFIYRENDNRLIGIVNIRKELNERYKRFGGNAGISIRPTERGKKYYNIVLYGILKYFNTLGVKHIMLDCDEKNIPSRGGIKSLGGVLTKKTYIDDLETFKEDYDIDVEKSIEDFKAQYDDYISIGDKMSKNEEIINVFYKEIVPEASKGGIDAWFRKNLLFSTTVEGKEITHINDDDYPELCVTSLNINNKKEFDRLLCEYVNMAIDFYNDGSLEKKLEDAPKEDRDRYLYKYIISSLFANASYYDFTNPISFLNHRIEMFKNRIIDGKREIYLSTIGATLSFSEEKAPIEAETPYSITGELTFDDGYKLPLPNVYVGVSDNKMFIYGVLSKADKNIEINKYYLKEIRKGFTSKINGAPEHYFLSDMLSLSLSDGMETVIVPFLPQRWNAKRSFILNRKQGEEREAEIEKQELIQNNLTNVLARYYSKLESISDSLNYTSFPFEEDDKIHLKLDPNEVSKCPVFNELVEYNRNNDGVRHR